jgi:hypothetical protein
VPFGIVDLSLAPTPAVGDSVAHILEEIGLERCGTHGTTACLALLNDAVKKGGVMACSRIGGLSGAFIPVSEDAGMIDAAEAGTLCLDKLEAMTAVCSVGLDMICVPGDTEPDTIAAIIADEAAIGMVNTKTTAVRIIPAVGKKVGDSLDWGGLFREYGKGRYDPAEMEKEIQRLMSDDDVTRKGGIYEYLLSGGERESALSIRKFTDSQKRAAYERQGGNCADCGKHFEFEEMHGDHRTPWSKGGHTSPDNLQMLCRACNLKKGGK